MKERIFYLSTESVRTRSAVRILGGSRGGSAVQPGAGCFTCGGRESGLGLPSPRRKGTTPDFCRRSDRWRLCPLDLRPIHSSPLRHIPRLLMRLHTLSPSTQAIGIHGTRKRQDIVWYAQRCLGSSSTAFVFVKTISFVAFHLKKTFMGTL